ncbi:GTP cyclohydrolase II [Sneathiella chinensis]|uniref:GTP cyclohydrolase-2 n=1 Tax=Sneathiella chinensis TaxID=349750 RepID=A0ABQ5TZC5_9PROT|nr:GTP cyclohydrolase II [Sneathiella chinensis]GLQ04964.1 GTP cyclohydrolase-2 [Sneathiella chinensis]
MSQNNPDTSQKIALRNVDRAIADLRRGLPAVITTGQETIAILSTEMAYDAEIRDLAETCGTAPLFAITAHRANVLHVMPTGDTTILLTIEDWMDASLMRALADATHDLDQPFRGPFTRLQGPIDPIHDAAIKINKLGRLLPSAIVCPVDTEKAASIAAEKDLSVVTFDEIFSYDDYSARQLRPVALAKVPLQGAENTRIQAFRPVDGGIEHLAILIGDPNRHDPVLARLHSECFTGDLIGSLKCDCGEQLRGAIKAISDQGSGVILYLAQEGRGIGLMNKLRAYKLQSDGFDTIDANERLGFDADERVFRPAAEMLSLLGFTKIRLMTNNPEKVEGLERCGIEVAERVTHKFPSNTHNELYLATKRKRSGHYL